MPNDLPLPPDLQHLIEKRSGEERRRGDEIEPAEVEKPASAPGEEKPAADRRQSSRRNDDA